MCWVELFVKCSFKEREAIYCCDLHSVPECFSYEIFFFFFFLTYLDAKSVLNRHELVSVELCFPATWTAFPSLVFFRC